MRPGLLHSHPEEAEECHRGGRGGPRRKRLSAVSCQLSARKESVAILLAAGGCSILFAFSALRIIVTTNDVSVFAINTIMLLGLGLAVDYSLFLVSRFREELPARGVEGAIVRTMETTGRAKRLE